MKVYKITAALLNEPTIDGPEKHFVYAGDLFIILHGTLSDSNATEVLVDDVADALLERLADSVDLVAKQVVDNLTKPTALEQQMKHVADARAEVGRRILSHASQGTQMNMAAAAAAGMFSDEQLKAFQAGVQWVAAIRQTGKQLAKAPVEDITDDKHWPSAPVSADALAELF